MPPPCALVLLVLLGSILAAEDYASNPSIKLYQEYVTINTTTGRDLSPAVEFWQRLADEAGVTLTANEYVEGYPVVVLKWPGTDSSLNSIMLNSHMDVVPANEEDGWTYPPFSAHLDANGTIWGRGTQDVKGVGLQYYLALKRLKEKNVTLLRDVYMTLMPDEEVGGNSGMVQLLKSDDFASMNVGFELDEGAPWESPDLFIFYQDKAVWQIQVDCFGTAVHGATLPAINTTAVGKCRNMMTLLLRFRETERDKLVINGITKGGVYTSVNLNKMKAGNTANNIIPNHATLVFDVRLAINVSETAFEKQLDDWATEAGGNINITFILKDPQTPATIITKKNPYWTAFKNATTHAGLKLVPIIPPGSTDARFVRGAGIPAIGFAPMPNTLFLPHTVNERLNASTFLHGIDIYEKIITSLANIPGRKTKSDPSVYVTKLKNKSRV